MVSKSKKFFDAGQLAAGSETITRHRKRASLLKMIFILLLVAFAIVTAMRFGRALF